MADAIDATLIQQDYSRSSSTATAPRGERRGLRHVELENRQDLFADGSGQRVWGELLARLLQQAYRALEPAEALGPT